MASTSAVVNFLFACLIVIVCIISAESKTFPVGGKAPIADQPNLRKGRFYGMGGANAAAQASSFSSGGGFGGYPFGGAFGGSHASAMANAGSTGFGYGRKR